MADFRMLVSKDPTRHPDRVGHRWSDAGLADPSRQNSSDTFGRQASDMSDWAGFAMNPSPTAGPSGAYTTRIPSLMSPVESERMKDTPELPEIFRSQGTLKLEEVPEGAVAPPEIQQLLGGIGSLKPLRIVQSGEVSVQDLNDEKPLRVGIASVSNSVASAGTHNVILGLRSYLDSCGRPGSQLFGIRNLAKGNEFEVISQQCRHFLNQGGCDLLHSVPLSRVSDRILGQVAKICTRLQLHGLVLLCGPSELFEVAKISDHFSREKIDTAVVAVAHSLSGWLQIPGCMEVNLGFDSACGILAEVAGNIALSQQSLSRDIYHFVACGSPPLTLEVAMQIHPTLCYLGDDVAQRELTLQAIIDEICDVIITRHHDHGLHFGVVMVSDDFFGQLVEMKRLRAALQRLRREKPAEIRSVENAQQHLPLELGSFFAMFPPDVCQALIFRTDHTGQPLLLPQETERELGVLVARNLVQRGAQGARTVQHFTQQPHSLRNIGISAMPTILDCALGFALGHVAGTLVEHSANGYAANVAHVAKPPSGWSPCALPLASLLRPNAVEGEDPVVRRRRLNPEDTVFNLFRRVRDRWRYQPGYRQPGPVQFWGPGASRPLSWATYTLRASFGESAQLANLVDEETCLDCDHVDTLIVSAPMKINLKRRKQSMLSALQKWRAEYKPNLPQVLRGPFRVTEEDRKGRVCADLAKLFSAFPNLWCTDNLKAVRIELAQDQINVLQMLPERPKGVAPSPLHRSLPSWNSETSGEHELGNRDSSGAALSGNRIGIALVGRAGPGVNNVVMGLYDYLASQGGTVVCIAMGIAGILEGHFFELDQKMLAPHRNQGGCDLLGQSQPEDIQSLHADLSKCAATVQKLRLTGLVIWGGRNVHSWTARLAEHFVEHRIPTSVLGVPASVQSDLPFVEQTIGYDTTCKMFASIVGNLTTQCASSGKLWCFVRIPGRSISHIAAEIRLETHPEVVLMSAEMDLETLGLPEVTQMICDTIEARSSEGKNFGVVLIPDQLLASVREMRQLFENLFQICRTCPDVMDGFRVGDWLERDFGPMLSLLAPLTRSLFQSFPERVRSQLCSVIWNLVEREKQLTSPANPAQGVVDLHTVETEVIFQCLVETELTRRVVLGTYKGPFQAFTYSLPYHGRGAMPSNFDCDFGYTIGYACGIFVGAHKTGLLVNVTKLKEDVREWEVGGVPLSSLLTFKEAQPGEELEGDKVDFEIRPRSRLLYDVSDEVDTDKQTVANPGPTQFAGPCAGIKTQTLCMPQLQRVRQMARAEQLIAELKAKASAGVPGQVLQAVRMILQGGVDLLKQI